MGVLEEERNRIDKIDREMLSLFLERMDAADKIAAEKKLRGLPVTNKKREQEILEKIAADSGVKFAGSATALFKSIFEISKKHQKNRRLFGLLGGKLSHSLSPQIQAVFGIEDYRLFEIPNDKLGSFFEKCAFDGINVTVPHKKNALGFCDELSDTARRLGCVNTVIRRRGRLVGDNTDYFGFSKLLCENKIDVHGKKAVILGNGGASAAVRAVLEDKKAAEIITVSRNGDNSFESISAHFDAQLLINATPVGMFPNYGVSPVSLKGFENLEAVIDLIYNPVKTALLLDAEKEGIKAVNGLSMLVWQALACAEIFSGQKIDTALADEAFAVAEKELYNIVLIGMPGSGKTTAGLCLSDLTGIEFFDVDSEIEKATGKTPAEIILTAGEKAFREAETEAVKRLSALGGKIIATGGGTPLSEENRRMLCACGKVVFLERRTEKLSQFGRPLSKNLAELERERMPFYDAMNGIHIPVSEDPQKTALLIAEALKLKKKTKKILVINGANLDLLGVREPEIYGKKSYSELCSFICEQAAVLELEAEIFQSNIEGEIVEKIHSARGRADGIIINPGGYTHTSVVIADALAAVNLPAAEVHLSDINSREDFRKTTLIGKNCEAHFIGKGFEGYAEALKYFLHRNKIVRDLSAKS